MCGSVGMVARGFTFLHVSHCLHGTSVAFLYVLHRTGKAISIGCVDGLNQVLVDLV
jgi:hypothetical protein